MKGNCDDSDTSKNQEAGLEAKHSISSHCLGRHAYKIKKGKHRSKLGRAKTDGHEKEIGIGQTVKLPLVVLAFVGQEKDE